MRQSSVISSCTEGMVKVKQGSGSIVNAVSCKRVNSIADIDAAETHIEIIVGAVRSWIRKLLSLRFI